MDSQSRFLWEKKKIRRRRRWHTRLQKQRRRIKHMRGFGEDSSSYSLSFYRSILGLILDLRIGLPIFARRRSSRWLGKFFCFSVFLSALFSISDCLQKTICFLFGQWRIFDGFTGLRCLAFRFLAFRFLALCLFARLLDFCLFFPFFFGLWRFFFAILGLIWLLLFFFLF